MTLIKKLLHNTAFWLLIWVAWMGVIFLFSHLPGSSTYYEPSIQLLIERKGAHVIEYFLLTLLAVQCFSLIFYTESLRKILALAVTWSLAYAATDELHQFFTPFRGANITDVLIDGLGIFLAVFLVVLLSFYKRKKTR